MGSPSSPTPLIRSVRWRDEPGELVEERLLGELDGLLEPGRDPRPLGLVQARRELDEIIGRLDAGEVPVDVEEADQRLGIVRWR